MRNHKGFTILELIVVVAVVALLASFALPQFYRMTLRAEALSAQGIIGTVRSALSLQMAQGLYQGDDLATWAHDGPRALYPMHDLLLERPENYLGVIADSNQRGSWYDDKITHELVYVVQNDEIVAGMVNSPIKVRWRVTVIYDELPSQQKQLIGLILKPATQHQWKFE